MGTCVGRGWAGSAAAQRFTLPRRAFLQPGNRLRLARKQPTNCITVLAQAAPHCPHLPKHTTFLSFAAPRMWARRLPRAGPSHQRVSLWGLLPALLLLRRLVCRRQAVRQQQFLAPAAHRLRSARQLRRRGRRCLGGRRRRQGRVRSPLKRCSQILGWPALWLAWHVSGRLGRQRPLEISTQRCSGRRRLASLAQQAQQAERKGRQPGELSSCMLPPPVRVASGSGDASPHFKI